MRLEAGRFAVAIATVWAIAGLVCAFVFKTAPAAYAAGGFCFGRQKLNVPILLGGDVAY